MTKKLKAFCEYIPFGEENAISEKELSKTFGINSKQVREIVFELRMNEIPILESKSGYFYPSFDEAEAYDELARYCRRYEEQLRKTWACLFPALSMLKAIEEDNF